LRKLFNFPQIWSNGVTISWSFILFFNKAKGLFQKPVKRFLILNAGNDLSKRSFVSWNHHYLEACIRNFNEFLRWKSPKRIIKEIPPSNSLLQKKILSHNCLHWQLSSTSMMWSIQIFKYWFVCPWQKDIYLTDFPKRCPQILTLVCLLSQWPQLVNLS